MHLQKGEDFAPERKTRNSKAKLSFSYRKRGIRESTEGLSCNFPGEASSKRLQMKLDLGTLRNTGVLYIIP